MISKIKNIKNVGRFRNFQGTRDDVAFTRNTFIFGNNTQGKSTFTAILKSLSTNNNDYIIGRKSFNGTDQNVVITDSESNDYIFNGTWNRNYNFKIFDNNYILDNIYSDDIITPDKQQKIASIILGHEGQKLGKVWEAARKAIVENGNKKGEISHTYSSTFDSSALNFKDFIKLDLVTDISEQVTEKENELKSLENTSNINQILVSTVNKLNLYNLEKIELGKTLELDQKIIEDHFNDHLKSRDNAIGFVSSGLEMMKENICPFCSQDIVNPATDLISAYNVLFSINYKKLKIYIDEALYFLINWDFETLIISNLSKLQELGLKITLDNEIGKFTEQRKLLIAELEIKSNDLTHSISISAIDELVEISTIIKKELQKSQEKYTNTIDSGKIVHVKNDVKMLRIQQQRFEKPWKGLCRLYQTLDANLLTILKPNEEVAFRQKTQYAELVLTQYNEKINGILEKLAADFTLTDFTIQQNRREAIKLFGIRFNEFDENIPIIGSTSEYNLSNTLSDSDKRLLAFAFFVVDIKNSDDISSSVIVLDDPMSSFDIDRKRHTIKILRDELYNQENEKPLQLIILTHEPNFYTMLKEYIHHETKQLMIKYFQTENTSKLIPCDVENQFLKHEHYKRLDYYHKCKEGEIDNINLSDMRIILEEVIKTKYYLEIPRSSCTSGAIIRWYRENIGNGDINREINDISPHLSHHTQSNSLSEEDYEESEKKDIVRDFLSLIKKI